MTFFYGEMRDERKFKGGLQDCKGLTGSGKLVIYSRMWELLILVEQEQEGRCWKFDKQLRQHLITCLALCDCLNCQSLSANQFVIMTNVSINTCHRLV